MQGTQTSFFPTRTHDKRSFKAKKRVYRLIKQLSDSPESKYSHIILPQKASQNIFDAQHLIKQQGNSQNPLSTVDQRFFTKCQMLVKTRKSGMKTQNQQKKRRTSASMNQQRQNITSQNINNDRNNNNDQRRVNTSLGQAQDDRANKMFTKNKPKVKTLITEEIYKSHSKYSTMQPLSDIFQTNTFARSKAQSQHSIRHLTQPQYHQSKSNVKLTKTIQQDFDKKALLGQIDRQRPLVELCGDKYFEMILRNRFKQDLLMPKYIYQIRDKFTENKIIAKLKKYKPEIMERQKLSIKGRNIIS